MGRTWLSMGHSSSSLGSNRHIIKILSSSYHHHRIYKIKSNSNHVVSRHDRWQLSYLAMLFWGFGEQEEG